MAAAKEIRTKIASIKNTQKITRAMEMVAASKMRRAQDRMFASRPYAQKIKQVIDHLSGAHPEYQHPYMQKREVKNVGVIVVSSDRGLCGGLNINLFKSLMQDLQKWNEEDVNVKMALIGSKATQFFKRIGGEVVAQSDSVGDTPDLVDLIGNIRVMLDMYVAGEIDALYLVSNDFVNTMTQKPTTAQILPVEKTQSDDEKPAHWDYIYEPDAAELLETLLTRYIESQVYQAVVENIACEQAARMVAMKSASDNAGDLIGGLQLAYNKARQAAITQELSEIVSGAAAV